MRLSGPHSACGISVATAVSLAVLLVAWGCSQDTGGPFGLAPMAAPATLELHVKQPAVVPRVGNGRAAVAPLTPRAVRLRIAIGNPQGPDYLAPPDFDVSGPADQVRETQVPRVPPGARKPVRYTAFDAQGRVVAEGLFYVDFYPGVLSTNDLELEPSGVITPVSPVTSGTTPPNPTSYFVTEFGSAAVRGQLVKVTLGSPAPTTLFDFGANSFPQLMARDGQGNFIVALAGQDQVVLVPPSFASQRVLNSTSIVNPFGVALDRNGDYLVSGLDPASSTSAVFGIPAGGGAPTVFASFVAGLTANGIVVDSSGQVFVALRGNPASISRVPPVGPPVVVFDYGPLRPMYPRTLAINPAGEFIVGEVTPAGAGPLVGTISAITPGGQRTQLTSFTGAFPGQIIHDSQGNLVFSEESNQRLDRISPTGVFSTVFTFPAGSEPVGLAQ